MGNEQRTFNVFVEPQNQKVLNYATVWTYSRLAVNMGLLLE